MGTLGNQKAHNHFSINEEDLIERIKDLKSISSRSGVSLDLVIQLEISMQLNRLNSILIESGDHLDENLAGIGKILEE